MTGTSEGGRKAAETRGHDSLSKAGKKGGQHSHQGNSHQKDSHRNAAGNPAAARKNGENSHKSSRHKDE